MKDLKQLDHKILDLYTNFYSKVEHLNQQLNLLNTDITALGGRRAGIQSSLNQAHNETSDVLKNIQFLKDKRFIG
jgi:prefoldin subunit 5